jgi:hypothetical protein
MPLPLIPHSEIESDCFGCICEVMENDGLRFMCNESQPIQMVCAKVLILAIYQRACRGKVDIAGTLTTDVAIGV